MTASSPLPSPRARQEASAWFARLRTTSLSAETLQRFEAWRDEPANNAAFQDLERVWQAGEALHDSPAIRGAVAEALARPPPTPRPIWRRAPRAALGLGVLAGGALAAAVVIVVAGSVGGLTYRTGVGGARQVALSDGSLVRLDTDSRITVRLTGSDRGVWLERGQAYFTVAHDPSRPFWVHAGDARVRAVGTQFDVRRDSASVEVVLVQGVVAVEGRRLLHKSSQTLFEGQAVTVRGGTAGPVRQVPTQDSTAWITGHIVFHDATLAAVVSEVNRYTPGRLVVAEGQGLDGLRVSGVFNTGDSHALLVALKDLYSLRATPGAPGVTVLQAPTGS